MGGPGCPVGLLRLMQKGMLLLEMCHGRVSGGPAMGWAEGGRSSGERTEVSYGEAEENCEEPELVQTFQFEFVLVGT